MRRNPAQPPLHDRIAEIEREGWGERPAIVIGREGWNHGIVGIVAGRLSDQFRRPVIAVGFLQTDAVNEIAPQYPDTDFAIVDSVVEPKNAASLLFREEEGSYLAGVVAGLMTQVKTDYTNPDAVMRDADFRSIGRNQRLCSHFRNDCSAASRGILNGSSPSGRTMFESGGASTTALVPQNAHALAETCGSSVVCAPQRLQTTTFRSAPHPRLRGSRNATSTERSRIASAVAATAFSNPQYPHFSAVAPGSQWRSAPHDSHRTNAWYSAP